MAELVWKGKYPTHDDISTTSTQECALLPTQLQLITSQRYTTTGEEDLHTSSPLNHWYNRLIHGDKSTVLPALQTEFMQAIKLIYIDPPFMTGRTFTSGKQVAYSDTWNNNLDSYLQWLYETLKQLYPLLTPDGSLYVHLDWRATHYAKIILDEIFDGKGAGFKNEIIWHYQSGGHAQKYFARKHDSILLYTKSAQYCFHNERVSIRRGPHRRNHMRKEVAADGRISWTIRSAGRTYAYSEDTTIPPSDVWSDISHLHQRDPERNGYATQKPAALLERIILTSSEEQDLVLDCFCGSGVTPAVAAQLGRRWIASDQSQLSVTTTCQRLLTTQQMCPFVLQQVAKIEPISNARQE